MCFSRARILTWLQIRRLLYELAAWYYKDDGIHLFMQLNLYNLLLDVLIYMGIRTRRGHLVQRVVLFMKRQSATSSTKAGGEPLAATSSTAKIFIISTSS